MVLDEANKIRTLIVEDEESFRLVLINVLQSTTRFEVVPCTNGTDALEILSSSTFDLVILDHKMPGKSGLNVLQWMHEQKLDTPVIMLTGAGSEKIAAEVMKLGAYDYIRKDQFDRHHFPIIASGVHERFLFRKERARRTTHASQEEKNIASIGSIHQSVSALTHTMNSALASVSLIADDCEMLSERLPNSDEKTKLRENLGEMRQEYTSVATVVKSIVELSRLMFDRLATIVNARSDERTVQAADSVETSRSTPTSDREQSVKSGDSP